MIGVTFKLEKRPDDSGQETDTLIKVHPDGHEETWTTIPDLDRLFDACAAKWPIGWDLEKLLTCIRECDFD